jgi:quercetin dioxygenase-like cupin family protein
VTSCDCMISRRAIVLGALGLGVLAGTAHGQMTEGAMEILGQGRTDFADAVGGPAELVMFKIILPPGDVIPWHTHLGPVFAVVNSGEITMYQRDGCKTAYGPGAAIFIATGTTHEERNEGTLPVELVAACAFPAGSQMRVPAAPPASAVCPPAG